jgi:hypothetical protein
VLAAIFLSLVKSNWLPAVVPPFRNVTWLGEGEYPLIATELRRLFRFGGVRQQRSLSFVMVIGLLYIARQL